MCVWGSGACGEYLRVEREKKGGGERGRGKEREKEKGGRGGRERERERESERERERESVCVCERERARERERERRVYEVVMMHAVEGLRIVPLRREIHRPLVRLHCRAVPIKGSQNSTLCFPPSLESHA